MLDFGFHSLSRNLFQIPSLLVFREIWQRKIIHVLC